MQDARIEIKTFEISEDEIYQTARHIKATTPPWAPYEAQVVFGFLMQYKDKAMTYVVGMEMVPLGLDILKLEKLFQEKYSMSIFMFEFAVEYLENKIIEQFNNQKGSKT